MHEDHHNPAEPDLELPESLRRALRDADHPGFSIPASVDRAVRTAARRQFRPAQGKRWLRVWAPVGAAAAAILLLFVFGEPLLRPGSEPTQSQSIAVRSEVTILDAFALARRLQTQQVPGPEWDYNADGTVDHRDVDALALAAVRLEDGA